VAFRSDMLRSLAIDDNQRLSVRSLDSAAIQEVANAAKRVVLTFTVPLRDEGGTDLLGRPASAFISVAFSRSAGHPATRALFAPRPAFQRALDAAAHGGDASRFDAEGFTALSVDGLDFVVMRASSYLRPNSQVLYLRRIRPSVLRSSLSYTGGVDILYQFSDPESTEAKWVTIDRIVIQFVSKLINATN
jgi:hypothetical protein